MKAAFLSGYLSRSSGGLFTSVRRLAESLRSSDWDVQVFGWYDKQFDKDRLAWDDPLPIALHRRAWAPAGYTPELPARLTEYRPDVVHAQFLWNYASRCNLAHSRRHGTPYVVSPRGMLDPWALRRSAWKKRVAGVLFEDAHLANARCIHALSNSEALALRSHGLRNPVCVIPNGVDVPAPSGSAGVECPPRENGPKTLLYLGRIHPKKGLANVLHAWHRLRQRDFAPQREWSLTIAGWDQGGHEAELKALAATIGLARHVTFVGPLFGDARDATLRDADAFILPSLSEGLPNAVLEAWAHGKPVLMTPQCNLPEGVAADAAIAVLPDPESLAEGLVQLFATTAAERSVMGRRGLELVQRRFAWPKIAEEMRAVYRWIVGGGAEPSCVARV